MTQLPTSRSAPQAPPQSAAAATDAPKSNLAVQLVLLAIAVGSGGYARTVLSPVQEAVRASLNLSDNSVALLQGMALALPVVAFGAPIGMLVDRRNRARVLLALLSACAFGTVLTGLAHNYPMMFFARMLVGVGIAGALPAALSISADLFPPGIRGRVNMILGFGQVAGAAIAFAVGGGLLDKLPASGFAGGWRGAVLTMAMPLVLVALAALFIREPPRLETEAVGRTNARQALKELRKYAGVIVPLIFGTLIVSMADAAAGIWAAPILSRVFHLPPGEIGKLMGVVVLVGGVIGVVAGGLLSDLGQRLAGHNGVLWVATAAAVISLPCAAFPVMPNVTAFAGLLAGLLVCGGAMGIAATTLFTLVIPNELRGFSIGLVLSGGVIVSTGVAPSAVSLLSGALGGPAHIAAAMTWVGVGSSLLGITAFFVAMAAITRQKPVAAAN